MNGLKRMFKAVYITSQLLLLCASVTGAAYISGYLPESVRIEQVTEYIRVKDKPTLETLLREVPPKYGVSSLLAAAIVEQESNGAMNAVRFEPSQMDRAAKITKNPDQQRMYASSHCALQIMGWWAPKYSLQWSDLYDPETCFEVGMTILKGCMDRHVGKSKVGQIRGALTCYNGSERYADVVLNRIGDLLIEKNL